jgi:hypothetical protein
VVPSLYDDGLISVEYEDTHPLYLFTHGPGHRQTKEKAIHKPGNLAGLKIRHPTTVVANLLEGLGAQPVGMNVFMIKSVAPDVSMGQIFGSVFPFVLSDLVRLFLLILFPVLAQI